MLNQLDIDIIMREIQSQGSCDLYYVADMIECREELLDESHYKSNPRYKVIKVTVTDVLNAYIEYKNYVENSSNYHIESEESYYDATGTRYIHYYTVPNPGAELTKDLNPRMPSAIYGRIQKIYDYCNNKIRDFQSESIVKPVFTNAIEYADLSNKDIDNCYKNGELDWKYITLENNEIVDGIEYKYVTSKYYILTLRNFPTVEKPLICVDQKCSYFRDLDDAFDFIDQLA